MEEKANSIYEMVGVYQVDLIIQNFHEDHFLNIQTNILLDGGHWSSCDCHISQCVIMKLNPSVVLELWNNVVITQALLMLIFGYQIFPYWNFSIAIIFWHIYLFSVFTNSCYTPNHSNHFAEFISSQWRPSSKFFVLVHMMLLWHCNLTMSFTPIKNLVILFFIHNNKRYGH